MPNFVIQGTGTIVNGAVKAAFTGGGTSIVNVEATVGSFSITSAGKVDDLNVAGARILGNAVFKLGDGDDDIDFGNSTIGGNLTLVKGPGVADIVFTNDLVVRGALMIDTQLATQSQVQMTGVTVLGKTTHLGSSKGGSLTVTNGTFIDGLSAKMGSILNTVSLTDIDSNGGLTIASGAGQDTFTANGLNIRGGLRVNLGDGVNGITIGGVAASVKLTTGTGNDAFFLKDLVVRGATSISSGLGDDQVSSRTDSSLVHSHS